MITKFTLRRCFWPVFIAILVSCGTVPTALTVTSTPTFEPIALHTQTPLAPSLTLLPTPKAPASPLPLPTMPNLPISTVQPTRTPLPASLPKFPLDGYVVLFKKDNDLYFQDGNKSPVKLTHIDGRTYPPYFVELSDDNQKVVFYQDDGNIYSVNTDGTHEQVVIPSNWSDSLEAGTQMGALKFIPKTHLLSFEAILCKEKSSISLCFTIIFLADADTGKIQKLADLGLALQNYDPNIQNNIRFSPDGKMMAVGTMEGMKIFTLDGEIIRQNILPFTPSTSDAPFPSLFWLPDSSGLIVALPDKIHPDPFYVSGAPAYTLWRCKIQNNSTTEIPFDPPVAGAFEVSPDGNWIVYGGISLAETELYLGNLKDGSAKIFGNDLMRNFQWSSDSKHFIHGNAVVISFDKPPVFGGGSTQWVDSNHFIYFDIPENNPTIRQERVLIAEIRGDEVYFYESGLPYPGIIAIAPKQ